MKRKLTTFLILVLIQSLIWPHLALANYRDWDKYVARFEEENKYLKHEGGLIVLLGDSITEFFPLEELRKRYNIINRGIRMDAVEDAYSRLKPSVLDIKPHTLFIMLGTNDICAYWLEPEEIITKYKKLLQKIKTELPDTKIVVQSVLLTRDQNYNNYIRPVNEGLFKLCQEMNLTFLDHNPGLAEGKLLGAKFTSDGIHLTPTGYDRLADNIRNYLASPVQVKYQGKLIFSRITEADGQQELMVNLRSFAEATGGKLQWFDGGEVKFTKGDSKLKLVVGNKKILHNDKELTLNTPPVVLENSLYLPLTPLADCLDYSFNTSQDKKIITIEKV